MNYLRSMTGCSELNFVIKLLKFEVTQLIFETCTNAKKANR